VSVSIALIGLDIAVAMLFYMLADSKSARAIVSSFAAKPSCE
jgi:hypothetical protein